MRIKKALEYCLFLILLFLSIHISDAIGNLKDNNNTTSYQKYPHTRYYQLNITSKRYNADCSDHQSSVLMVNNRLPGTPIYLVKGDRVLLNVCNNIEPDTRINGGVGWDIIVHLHGILQIGSPGSDGVPYLTQRPIAPGECFLHDVTVVNQEGTYFYHAHVGLKEMSVYGAIIVYESERAVPKSSPIYKKGNHRNKAMVQDGPFKYHDEHTLLISEWFHADTGQFEEYFLGTNFAGLIDADTILINGQGIYNEEIDIDNSCKGYAIIPVEPSKTLRLRIIGGLIFRTIGFALAGHKMKVIEVDGNYVKPYEVDYLEVSPAQRFSVLITTDQAPGDYGINIQRRLVDSNIRMTNGHAIMRYQKKASSFKAWYFNPQTNQRSGTRIISAPENQPVFPADDTHHWYWNHLVPYYGVDHIASKKVKSNRTILLRSSTESINNITHWYVNNEAHTEDSGHTSVLLYDVLNKTRPLPNPRNRDRVTGYDSVLKTYPLQSQEIVDIVLQTTLDNNDNCRYHPWHTHGHFHWEIAYGHGEYIEKRDGHIRNVPTPIAKDLTLVYVDSDEEILNNNKDKKHRGCGWSKIRIIANNPGIWAIHCHVTPHMFMGMMAVLEEAPELINDNMLPSKY
ncbi:Cupredoxin [Cokeromyces recurvatus]|uniref:Cupredoxin n=1 Tax=Cokeromyces recurvatus TaxID=90255 RepID=UPI00222014C3|nr:Cupredoxin [Cokeromyces recurvatus]KAI7906792.1 Cupredoxin [Cokeromyces recurvatus]